MVPTARNHSFMSLVVALLLFDMQRRDACAFHNSKLIVNTFTRTMPRVYNAKSGSLMPGLIFRKTEVAKLSSLSRLESSTDKEEEGADPPPILSLNMMESFLNGLWKGVTLPFPSLRGLARSAWSVTATKKEIKTFGVGWSVKESLLAIIAYLMTGVVAYSFLLEKWSVVDALYFSCVCFSTVGYGDLCPKSPSGRLFTCFFGVGGIVFLGTSVATIASHVIQAELQATRIARQTTRHRLAQFIDHKVSGILTKLTHPQNIELEPFHHHSINATIQSKALKHTLRSTILDITKQVMPSLCILFLGGIWMGRLSGWNWLDSIYYAVVTASTIGLGDLAPSTRAARLWAMLFIPLSVATVGELLSNLATALVQRRQKVIFRNLMERDLTMTHLQAMDLDNSGQVSREEYVQFMLLEMGHVSLEEILELQAQFARLDVAKTGYLDQNDLMLLAELRKQESSSVLEKSSV